MSLTCSPTPNSCGGALEELPTGDEFCIGVAWQGNPDYNRDRFRSFRLEQLEPVRAGVRAAL